MNILFGVIIAIILFDFISGKILDLLNLKNLSPEIPKEAEGIYDAEKYKKSQEYYRVNHNFSMLTDFISLALILGMLFLNGFAFVDTLVRKYTENPILMALLFFGLLGLASDIIRLPFSIYDTFVIEEKFGFNKTTIKTFIIDKIKGYLIAIILGGGLLAVITWIYQSTGSYFWLLTWAVVSLVSVFITMFYTSIFVPLFNKLTPLPEGELRTAIENYCTKTGFKLKNLFVLDASKRSAKSNAYFSGLGAKKTIVLFDTLIEKHSIDELVAVLAHEIGHYKMKHTLTGTIQGILQTGLMLFIMSLFLGNPVLSKALGTAQGSFHLDILAFGLLYSPLSMILGIITNVISRKHEYQADAFAKNTFNGSAMQAALKKLTADNLSNLKPHPAYVFVHYSHPSVLDRLKRMN